MKRISGLFGVALFALGSSAQADEYYAAGPEMFAAGSVLLSVVTPSALAGVILYTPPRSEKAAGIGFLAGAGAALSVGLPLFLLGQKSTGDPPIAVGVGAGRMDLRVTF